VSAFQKNLKKRLQVKVPAHLTKFNAKTDQIKFNTIGLFNTNRDKALYRIIAKIAGQEYLFNQIDWKGLQNSVFRLKDQTD